LVLTEWKNLSNNVFNELNIPLLDIIIIKQIR
jgi:hypothetical protein